MPRILWYLANIFLPFSVLLILDKQFKYLQYDYKFQKNLFKKIHYSILRKSAQNINDEWFSFEENCCQNKIFLVFCSILKG